MPVYYPSAKIRLRLRLDEIDQPTSLVLPPTRITERSSAADVRDALTKLRYRAVDGVIQLEPRVTGAALETAAEGEVSADGFTHAVTVLPHSCSIERNGIRAADTFKAEFPFVDIPFEPRLIRAAAVEVYLGVVPAGEWASGVRGRRRGAGGDPLSLVPDTGNLRLLGFVDTWGDKWPESGRATVVVEGRDLTGLLLDATLPSAVTADLNLPLDEAVADVMTTLPACVGMSVEMRPRGTEAPLLARAVSRQAVARRGARGRTRAASEGTVRRSARGSSDKTSYWDYITDLVGSAGFVCFVDGKTVVIQTPRSVYGSRFPKRDDDLFFGRTVEGEWSEHRRFVYGRNVVSMESERKYGGKRANTVEVRCYDFARKETLVERFPPDARVTNAPPGESGGDEKIDVFRLSGITDRAVLRRHAQSIYEQQARNELAFKIETRDLASFGGDNEDPDLLDLRDGDAVEVLVARDQSDEITRLRGLSAEDRTARLVSLGFPRNLALRYAALLDSAGFQTAFRVREAHFDFSQEDGVKITVDAINYLVVREEHELPAGEEPTSPRTSGQRARRGSADDPLPVDVLEDPAGGDDPLYPLNLERDLQ